MITTITVDNASPGTPISPDLWGIFFEDINYSADGGLYAELVRNRSFDYGEADAAGWGPLTGWRTELPALAAGTVTVRTIDPFVASSPSYVAIAAERGSVALANEGFDGIRVTANAAYRLSLRARTPDGAGARLAVAVRDVDGTIAQATIGSIGDTWDRAEAVLTAARGSESARLELVVAAPAVVEVDHVSLFPVDTFRGQGNGLRRDLAETIEALRPRFMRFPGGCVAHGLGLENTYRWKRTLGPVERRAQMFNLWGYHQSMGLGYFEYFRFCEDIGAKPLPVVAAGVCCQNTIGGPQAIGEPEMADYVREVLDLVEFANGSIDTAWGALRAELGHPEPFGLEYLAIGNEDQQDDVFRDRFSVIYHAVREAHPEIVLIGTVGPSPFGHDYDEGWEFARRLGVAMVDEHSYKSPRWFFENLGRFDSYDRSGPAVYLGEYGSKGNTMLNALAEAAYMMAMERNGDVVRLASYAPLLAKVGHTQWTPDLIYFDNATVMPTLNYHVQRMHAVASGDRAVPVTVERAPSFVRPRPGTASVSIRGENADVTLTDVTLNDETLAKVRLRPGDGTVVLPLRTDAEDYTISLTACQASGDDGFAIGFGALDSPNWFEWNFGTWKNRSLTLFRTADGNPDELLEPKAFSVEVGRTYAIEIRVEGRDQRITCLLDGAVVSEYEDTGRPEQRFSATAVADSDADRTFVKIVNATDRESTVALVLTDANAAASATRTTLAAQPDDGAPFVPAPAEPVVDVLTDVATPFTVPAHSFTVLALTPHEERDR